MLLSREIRDKFKEIFDHILLMSAAALNGGRELAVLRNVLTFSTANLTRSNSVPRHSNHHCKSSDGSPSFAAGRAKIVHSKTRCSS